MPECSKSRFAAYKGIIALAWADHVLDKQEKESLHQMIDNNIHLSEKQKQTLNEAVDTKISLKDVWEEITELKDRAFVLDVAGAIFIKMKIIALQKKIYMNLILKSTFQRLI